CGSSATLRYIAFTLDSSSLGSKVVVVVMLVSPWFDWRAVYRPRRAAGRSKAERRGAGLDQLVNFARPGDLDPVDEVALLVAARLDARRAGPQAAAARQKILDQGGQRLRRGDHCAVYWGLCAQIHRGARP